jgi:hypothetical protein
VIFYACVVSTAIPANAQPPALQDQFILSTFHLGIVPDRASVVSAGNFETTLRLNTTNSYVANEVFTVDLEQRLTELLLTYGFDERTQIDVGIPYSWRGGGVFDHTIRQWHKWWGLPAGDRQLTENNQFLVEGATEHGTFSIPEAGFGLGNMTARIKRQLTDVSGSPSDLVVSSALTLSLPTAEPGFGQDAVDTALELLAGLRRGPWEFNGGMGVVLLLDRFEKGISYKPLVPQGFFGASYEAFDNVRLSVSAFGGVQTIDNIPTIPDGFVYVDFGVDVGVADHSQCSVMVRENPYPSRASADVTLSLSCTQRW